MSAEDQSRQPTETDRDDTSSCLLVCALLLVAAMGVVLFTGLAPWTDYARLLVWVAGLGFGAVVCMLMSIRQALVSKRSS